MRRLTWTAVTLSIFLVFACSTPPEHVIEPYRFEVTALATSAAEQKTTAATAQKRAQADLAAANAQLEDAHRMAISTPNLSATVGRLRSLSATDQTSVASALTNLAVAQQQAQSAQQAVDAANQAVQHADQLAAQAAQTATAVAKDREDEYFSFYNDLVPKCGRILNGFNRRATMWQNWGLGVQILGVVAGTVVGPALTAANAAANKVWTSGFSGVAGTANTLSPTLASRVSEQTQTAQNILTAFNKDLQDASSLLDADKNPDWDARLVALNKAAADCNTYAMATTTTQAPSSSGPPGKLQTPPDNSGPPANSGPVGSAGPAPTSAPRQ